ncbi:MAG: hypothetical protein MUF75_03535 [Bacteroidia bacterium]|jgi:uncharacterized membrane protein YqgA involved in biofilm formation|nr:hypothetical protein [Bacteroidia bacterium]
MKTILRNSLAVVTGIIIGSVVNMALVNAGPMLIQPPAGVDISTYEGLKASMHLFQPKHFLFPWLAHALGTLVGAFLAAKIAGSHHRTLALVVGILFLIAGIMNVVMLPSPLWFTLVDLLLAYLPMAWLGSKLAKH